MRRVVAPQGAPLDAGVPGLLTFEIECLTSRTARRGGRHAVTLRGDGTLETPHDLAAERVAAAFGGYCSCVDIVDLAVPALVEVVGLLTRRVRPDLHRRADGRWALRRSVACECPRGFTSAAAAAQHAREARHIAARHRIPERLVRLLVDGFRAVLPAPGQLADHTLQGRVREPGGLVQLWAAGLHPDDLAEWAALAGAVDEPLPSSYYLGVAYGGVSTEFMAATLPARPDGDTAAWLAWLPPELQRPEECRALLAAGLPRQDVVSLLAAGESPDRLTAVAEECGLAREVVARLVAGWARAGCVLDAGHVGLVVSHGLAAHRPSAAVLDDLEKAVAGRSPAPGRADLGVMAALLGGRSAVLEALEGGVRSAAEAVNWMEKR